jgi:hypothetical protein
MRVEEGEREARERERERGFGLGPLLGSPSFASSFLFLYPIYSNKLFEFK